MCSNCECNASVPSESEREASRNAVAAVFNVQYDGPQPGWKWLIRGETIESGDTWFNVPDMTMDSETSLIGQEYPCNLDWSRLARRVQVEQATPAQPQEEEGFSLLCEQAQQWWLNKPEPPTGFRYLGLTETVVRGDRWVDRQGYNGMSCQSAVNGTVYREINGCGWDCDENERLSAIIRPIVSEVNTEAEPHVSPLPDEGFLTMREADIVDDKTRMDYVFDVERIHYDAEGRKVNQNVRTMLSEKYPHGYGMAENGLMYEIGYTGKQKNIAFDHLIRNVLRIDRYSTSGARTVERLYAITKWTVLTADGEALHDVFESYRPGSCMSYEKCRHLREIYAQNPDSVAFVYMRKTDNPLAESDCSALYWIGKKRIYLDRMYSSGSIDTKRTLDVLADFLEHKYAKPCVYIYGGGTAKRSEYTPDVTFKLNNPSTPLPYIDTLCYVKDYSSEHIWLSSKRYDVCAQNTQGTWPDGRHGVACCDCGECGDQDDMTEDDDGSWYCSSCWSDRQSYCQWSEESYPSDQVSEVRVYARATAYQQRRGSGEVCWRYLEIAQEQLDSDFVEASDSRGYIHCDHYVETNRGDTVANDPDSGEFTITEDGEIYHPDDVVQVNDGRIMPMDDCIEIDGTWYVSGGEPEAEETEAEETEEATEATR